MPIASDNAKFSIDFSYEWNAPDGTTYEYQMKFLHGSVGPIIQIANGHETLEFPAAMFTETAEFLVSQGVLRGLPTAKKSPFPTTLGLPTISKKAVAASPVAPPAKKGPKTAAFHSFDSRQPEVDGDEAEEDGDDGVEMLPPPDAKTKKRGGQDRPPVTGVEGVSPEEAQRLSQERLAAKAKEKAAEKKLQKRHRAE
jgi:hypothetical protein